MSIIKTGKDYPTNVPDFNQILWILPNIIDLIARLLYNFSMVAGIQYVTDDNGKPVAVQIDLRKYGALWQDMSDIIIAETRKREPHSSWEDVKKRLKKPTKNK